MKTTPRERPYIHEPTVVLNTNSNKLEVEFRVEPSPGDQIVMSVELFNQMIERFNRDR